MLNKNCPESRIIVSEDGEINEIERNSSTRISTPCHRIKMTSGTEVENNNKSFMLKENNKRQTIQKIVASKKIKKVDVKICGSVDTSKKFQNVMSNNHKLTDFFPVRRSIRKCKKTVLEEKKRDIENKVRSGIEEGLEVHNFLGKGRGVVTTRNFVKGEFVVEYLGELIDIVEAKKRESKYAKDTKAGCYMYYFQHKNTQYCVDATAKSNKLGRLVNHSRNGNLVTRIIEVDNIPHLILIAKEDIPAGSELCYDYGDRSRESIRNHPWLAF